MALVRRTLFYAIAALLLLVSMHLGSMARERHKTAIPHSTIPAYHATPPKGRLAPTLSPLDFRGNPLAEHAYASAAQIEPLLYQLPCYCHSGRKLGHTSLLSCYQTRHASECPTCLMETYYAYQQSRLGKTSSQIRRGIIRGDWKRVNLKAWRQPFSPKPGGGEKASAARATSPGTAPLPSGF